jgi:polar amino acid transport system ATP-binding protein
MLSDPFPEIIAIMSEPILEVRNLRKSYGDISVLKGVSFEVERGDLVSIIGPSGCGKSTLLRCLNALETLDSGTIRMAGVTLERSEGEKRLNPKFHDLAHELRQRVGMVFQQFNLFPNKTILENVLLAPLVVNKEPREVAEENALRQLEKVGLSGFAHRFPAQLSGGQQQRAAIARALAMHPQVMLYDEPTSALDPMLVDEVLAVMKALDAEGMTQIVVTHEIRYARDASDYIIYMEQGEIVEISDEDEIFTNPKDERTRRFLHRFA